MPQRPSSADSELLSVAASVEALEQRVAALEETLATIAALVPAPGVSPVAPPGQRQAGARAGTRPAPPHPAGRPDWNILAGADAEPRAAGSAPSAAPPESAVLTAIALAGQTLMVLGGAYLLRALTEARIVPISAGVFAGFTYALVWLAVAAHVARQGGRTAASFYGLAAALIGFPLVWEASTRFALLTPVSGALVLGAFAGTMLLVSFRQRLESVAWFASLGATIAAAALAIATRGFAPYTIVLVLVAISALWIGYLREWVFIRWPVAGVANLMTLAVAVRAVDPDVVQPLGPVIALLLFPVGAFLGSFVARTLFLGREVIPFEVTQSAAVMAVGFGGALAVLHAAGASAAPLGTAALLLGTAAYAFAFGFVEPRRHWRNFAFYTSLAVAFVTAGVALVMTASGVLIVFGTLAIACAEAARRSGRLTLALHAVLYAGAMAWASGLLTVALYALAAPAGRPWPAVTPAMLLALATFGASVLWPRIRRSPPWITEAGALQLTRAACLVWMASGIAVALTVPLLAGTPGSGADPGVVATVRTATLVIAVALVLLTVRDRGSVERTWLVYGLLGLAGLKLVIEDLPNGRPATLFLGLALYGAALVFAPRFARQGRQQGIDTRATVPRQPPAIDDTEAIGVSGALEER